MKFKIDGVDATTGAERSVVIDAADEAEARRLAQESGMRVASVKEIKESGGAPEGARV